MDVQALEMSIGLPRLPGMRGTRPATTKPASTPPGGDDARADAAHGTLLLAYTAASIVAGVAALAWTTAAVPILPAIDPGLDGTALAGRDGGLLLWIAFGLVGSLRVLPIPGSSGVWTFHFPFIAAAMVLGGPTAGAWVGFLATIERRELESQPWYGVLANHSVMSFAAVVGGLTVQVVAGALEGAGAEAGLASLAATAAGTLVLAAVANGIATGTIVMRQGLPASSVTDIMIRTLGRVTVVDIALAWLFTVAFLAVGWWAPFVIAAAVVIVWPAEIEADDPLSGLPRLAAFQRALNAKLGRAHLGARTGGLLLMIDLDGFGQINKDPQLGFDVGNEVLAETGKRLREQTRVTDLAARLGGDEFAAYFTGAFDTDMAIGIGQRVERAIRRPVVTTAGVVQVGVSIGVLVVGPWGGAPDVAAMMRSADSTMQRQKRAGGGVRLVEPLAEEPVA